MEAYRQQRDVARAQWEYEKQNNPDSGRIRCLNFLEKGGQICRGILQQVVLSVLFDVVVYVLILLNVGALWMTIPAYRGMAVNDAGLMIILVCNIFFAIEIVLRMGAFGLWKPHDPPLPRKPFFRSILNIIELVVCIMAFAVPDKVYTAVRALRFLKVRFVHLLPSQNVCNTRQIHF